MSGYQLRNRPDRNARGRHTRDETTQSHETAQSALRFHPRSSVRSNTFGPTDTVRFGRLLEARTAGTLLQITPRASVVCARCAYWFEYQRGCSDELSREFIRATGALAAYPRTALTALFERPPVPWS